MESPCPDETRARACQLPKGAAAQGHVASTPTSREPGHKGQRISEQYSEHVVCFLKPQTLPGRMVSRTLSGSALSRVYCSWCQNPGICESPSFAVAGSSGTRTKHTVQEILRHLLNSCLSHSVMPSLFQAGGSVHVISSAGMIFPPFCLGN